MPPKLPGRTHAIVVGMDFSDPLFDDRMAEAAELVSSAGAIVAKTVSGRRVKPDAGTFAGCGKIEEIAACVAEYDANLVVFNHQLSPIQIRNIEKIVGVRVIDRTDLILDIFAQRARSAEGKLQVELAQMQHLMTRLIRGWTHLERQRGGIGVRGGPGETQLEMDRRLIGDRIKRLKEKLQKLGRQRSTQRAGRKRAGVFNVSIVGYTNAGKSTLFNRLTGADVVAEDMLFATLDPTMRAIRLPAVEKAILSDTVGFISDLPTQLVAAFRATLEEVTAADVIVHVRDIANPDSDGQKRQVMAVLADLGLAGEGGEGAAGDGSPALPIPILEVWNKWDLLGADDIAMLAERRALRSADPIVAVSALTGQGTDALLAAISTLLTAGAKVHSFVLSASDGQRLAWLHANGEVVSDVAAAESGGAPQRRIAVRLSPRDLGRYANL